MNNSGSTVPLFAVITGYMDDYEFNSRFGLLSQGCNYLNIDKDSYSSHILGTTMLFLVLLFTLLFIISISQDILHALTSHVFLMGLKEKVF